MPAYMPDAESKPLDSSHPFDCVVYVPCHFDYSQVEYVTPFLERFGGKVFIYKTNRMAEKITKYFQEGALQKSVSVHTFSLENIVRCILKEEKKVVFLLTSSTAYPFGVYQKNLLGAIQKRLPDRVGAVSVVGHCMYGCMSCTGADHKIPVYFSRYFNNLLPYTAASIRQTYKVVNPSEARIGDTITVLVAPSTGSTSLVVQRDIIEYLWQLQQEGKYRFIWKLHPSAFNSAEYLSSTDETDINEYRNLQFIFENFEVTPESEPALLPFFEAFDVILCDLHSSVPFTALYFAPKILVAFKNDHTDYEVPHRDPEFLKSLTIYETLEELKPLLETLPAPKGDPSFFHSQYGHVDGKEELRFAELAKWPKKEENDNKLKPISTANFREILHDVSQQWVSILRDAYRTADKEKIEDCKHAIGLAREFVPEEDPLPETTKPAPITGNVVHKIRVMTFNTWCGGEKSGLPLEQTAEVIRAANADIVGLQGLFSHGNQINSFAEVAGMPDENQVRTDNTKRLAEILGYHYLEQGIVVPSRGSVHPAGIISRYPLQATPNKRGVRVTIPEKGVSFWLFNMHFAYFPYQPYQLVSIPYEDQPFLTTEQEAVDSCNAARRFQLDRVLEEMQEAFETNEAIFFTGDFNEPSFRDWTVETAVAGVHPIRVRWPITRALEELGFVDAYRSLYTNPVRNPGFTWCSITKEDDPADHHDRIDFIMSKGNRAMLEQVEIVGEAKDKADIVVTPYPSDHRAVVATYGLLSPTN